MLYLLGFVVYFIMVEKRLLLTSKIEEQEKIVHAHIEGSDDGFNFLREKPKLDSKADQLLRK
jgi:hypothetical protein